MLFTKACRYSNEQCLMFILIYRHLITQLIIINLLTLNDNYVKFNGHNYAAYY